MPGRPFFELPDFLMVDGGPGLIFNGAFYAYDDITPPGVHAC